VRKGDDAVPATVQLPSSSSRDTTQDLGGRATGKPSYSVTDLCRRWKIGSDKIHAFIRKGELVAINVAASLSGRPQWRISPEAVELFERRRSSTPPAKPQRRRRQSQALDYYPGP
jgi:hypothetical protein